MKTIMRTSNLPTQEEIIANWNYSENLPKVSIACITYNHKEYIENAITGFLIQKTNFPFEVIIHDDASNDGTVEIIKRYQNNYPKIIKAVLQKENQYSKGNKARILIAPYLKGEYIATCEGDDYWCDPNKLQIQFDYLEKHPEVVVSGHDAYTIDTKGSVLVESRLANKHKRDYTGEDMMKGKAYMLYQNLFYRNIDFGYIPEGKYIANGDVFTISLLGQYGNSHYHHEIQKSVHVKHSGGVWAGSDSKRKLEIQINSYFWIYKYFKRIEQSNISKIYWSIYLRKVFQYSSRIDLVREFLIRILFIREIYHYIKKTKK